MRIIRFISNGQVYFGQQLDDTTALELVGDDVTRLLPGSRRLHVDRLLAPLVPTNILCIGLNYREHAAETKSRIPDHPMLFIKASNALNGPFEPIYIPLRSSQIDYEGELAIIIGKTAKHVSRDQALEHVFGYTCANDVSARDWQRDPKLGGGQFSRGKSFDGFCPLGPCIVTRDEIPSANALKIRTTLNGQVMQDNTTADMIFDIPALIESLSSTMTLHPGTVILTGTPQGVGMARDPVVWMKPGDRVIVEIEKIGRLENPIEAE